MADKSEVLQICLLFLPCTFLEICWTAIPHCITFINQGCKQKSCSLHLHCASVHIALTALLTLPACSGFPSRSALQSGVSTEEGCHHCLHRQETQGCSCPPAAVRLGHLCSLRGIYTFQISIFCYVFALENTLRFWHCLNYFILVYQKHSQHPTFYLIYKKKIKNHQAPNPHTIKGKNSVPGCKSHIISPAADATVGSICLPSKVHREYEVKFVIFEMQNFFAFSQQFFCCTLSSFHDTTYPCPRILPNCQVIPMEIPSTRFKWNIKDL